MFGDWVGIGTLELDSPDEEEDIMDLRVNAIVTCKLRNGVLVPARDKVYDDKISVKIIGWRSHQFSSTEFVVYVPEYETARIKTDLVVSRAILKDFGVDKKFLGDAMTYIKQSHVCRIDDDANGEECVHCKEWFEKAEANQADGSFKCQSCVFNPYR